MENVTNAQYFFLIALHAQMINAKFVQNLHWKLPNACHLAVWAVQLLMDQKFRYAQNAQANTLLTLLHIVANAKLGS